ncbi:hypothetical protein DESUT3_28490 [Desulfuromonas versatilis]|uniref:DUF2141 domain-containing protein n=1 Tax=Desulfuromonas versatilis TaxID=2802975 RepID=A0ABN6E0A1_9BACT|nr:hypothetical protein [Desulfuromonas versatilis]BCR05780.1 hypothetical protein DESUT3_28490 [Desulfuromonas versatilis]
MRRMSYGWISVAMALGVVFVGCGGGGSDRDPVPVNANVLGTLMLPEAVDTPTYQVYIDDDTDPTTFVARSEGICACNTAIDYFFNNVPPGTYYIYGIVRMNQHLDGPAQPNDFLGFYGTLDGQKPDAPNLVVPGGQEIASGIEIRATLVPPAP